MKNFSLPTPSFQDAINLYNAYSYLGAKAVPVVATTSLMDGIMAKNFSIGRNYFGLSAFWGYIAHKAISNLDASEYISNKYKTPLKIFFALSAVGMVYKGHDFLSGKDNSEISNIFKSSSISAKLFESEQKEITKVEKAFDQGFVTGITETAKNFKAIIKNKFLLNLFMKQSLNIVNLILMEKIFSKISETSEISNYYASKEKDGIKKITKNFALSITKLLVETGTSKIRNEALDLKKPISKQVANLVLKKDNANIVMKLGQDVNNFAYDVKKASEIADLDISRIANSIIVPYIYANNTSSSENLITTIEKYPTLILFEHIMKSILSTNNMENLCKYFIKTDKNDIENGPGVAYNSTSHGSMTINFRSTSEQYAYKNIQDINRFGGTEFMLSQVEKYIDGSKEDDTYNSRSPIQPFIEEVNSFFHSIILVSLLPSLEFNSLEEMNKVTFLLYKLDSLIEGNTFTNAIRACNINEILSRCKNTYEALLNRPKDGIAERSFVEDFSLQIQDYTLNNIETGSNMLKIQNLSLHPGNIYAISGKVGTGKTTLLSDIANCLNSSIFKSSGTILYPKNNGDDVPMIFCGTEPFTPPDTTLFERLTYRLPQEFVSNNKEELTGQILDLFKNFGQDSFTKETLSSKDLKVSTGQGKIIIFISAILYKQYLESPVLFAIDETLANLDRGTFNSACKVIKSQFKDSILISVDHNWDQGKDFYSNNIDLNQYNPNYEENENIDIIGHSEVSEV